MNSYNHQAFIYMHYLRSFPPEKSSCFRETKKIPVSNWSAMIVAHKSKSWRTCVISRIHTYSHNSLDFSLRGIWAWEFWDVVLQRHKSLQHTPFRELQQGTTLKIRQTFSHIGGPLSTYKRKLMRETELDTCRAAWLIRSKSGPNRSKYLCYASIYSSGILSY